EVEVGEGGQAAQRLYARQCLAEGEVEVLEGRQAAQRLHARQRSALAEGEGGQAAQRFQIFKRLVLPTWLTFPQQFCGIREEVRAIRPQRQDAQCRQV